MPPRPAWCVAHGLPGMCRVNGAMVGPFSAAWCSGRAANVRCPDARQISLSGPGFGPFAMALSFIRIRTVHSMTPPTIYVCTVHYKTERWIKHQLRFLKKNMDANYKVFACVPSSRTRKDFHLESSYDPSSSGSQNHADKLNYLARMVCEEANDNDMLVFLDGDAFPIAPVARYLTETLQSHPFMAVQRLENGGDDHPHPSFAATTVGFWKAISGDWSVAPYINRQGVEVADTGGALFNNLAARGIAWHAMLRSNRRNLHPLWYGIYAGIAYHHGAGYRSPVSRIDSILSGKQVDAFLASNAYKKSKRMHRKMLVNIRYNPWFYRMLM